MHNECQKILIVEAVSLILPHGKIDNETQQTTSTVVLIAQIIGELKIVSTDSVNSF